MNRWWKASFKHKKSLARTLRFEENLPCLEMWCWLRSTTALSSATLSFVLRNPEQCYSGLCDDMWGWYQLKLLERGIWQEFIQPWIDYHYGITKSGEMTKQLATFLSFLLCSYEAVQLVTPRTYFLSKILLNCGPFGWKSNFLFFCKTRGPSRQLLSTPVWARTQ